MPTIDEIIAQQDAAVAIQDQKIMDAISLKNNGVAGMDAVIHTLMEQRQTIYLAAYTGALNSNEMTKALAVLKAATADMNTVAAKMVSATEFISNVAAFGTAANKVVSALKGAG
jgi:hypothetical protein